MNQQDIAEKLNKWMIEFVEVPNPKLGDWAPCPYARQARVNNNIAIKFAEMLELTPVLRESIDTLENKEVVIICFDHTQIDPVDLQEYVTGMNNTLMPMGYVILEDHPFSPEYINGVSMNFGPCGLLILQKLDKLNQASDQLRDKGYYTNWSQRDLDSVVTWRYK
jgi:hypothetical protein